MLTVTVWDKKKSNYNNWNVPILRYLVTLPLNWSNIFIVIYPNCGLESLQCTILLNIYRTYCLAYTRRHCVEQQTCTKAWKIFRICFWMSTEKMVASASSWVMSCWIRGKKICIAASKGSLSSAFLYLSEHTQKKWDRQ